MFAQLTNANPLHRGQPISIRTDLIVTVHANTALREDGSTESVTYLFVPPHGTWEVQESYETVMGLLNGNPGRRNRSTSTRD